MLVRPVTLLVTTFCILGGVSPAVASLQDGLVAYYSFDGDALDHSGHGNNCTVFGATLTADRTGLPSAAYSFSGGAYMDCGGDASLRLTGPITLAAWVDPLATSLSGHNKILVGKWSAAGGGRSYALYIQVDDQRPSLCGPTLGPSLVLTTNGSGATANSIACSPNALVAGQWVHVAAVFDPGKSLSVYLNGQLQVSNSQAVVTSIFDGAEHLYIGVNEGTYFQGALDDVRVYGRALSVAEISQLAMGTVSTSVPATSRSLLGLLAVVLLAGGAILLRRRALVAARPPRRS
jgi:hypothetical protein